LDGQRFRVKLERDARSPGRARRDFGEWLARLDCPDDVHDDVLLMISELVTNAVVHADSAPDVAAIHRDGRLVVEVHDSDPTPPVMRSDGGGPDGGFGLQLVEALSLRWGWEPTATGKRVWAEALC